jgi:preprotein translocase subunit SecB
VTDPTREPGIRTAGIVVDRIRFDDIEPGEPTFNTLDYKIAINRAAFEDPAAIEVTVVLFISPEQGVESRYSLEVAVTGRFETDTTAPNMPLSEFARYNGPAVVMPFVREIVANITARSRRGLVLLPAVNVQALVNRESAVQTES